jgi:hypothetical protein
MSGVARVPWAVLAAAAFVTACGGELSSAAWVREPEGGGALGDPVTLERDEAAAYRTSEARPLGSAPRLDHTVTLGEVVATGPSPASPAAPATSQPSITINVNNYAQHGGAGYYAEVPVFVASSSARTSTSTAQSHGASNVQPGQDWPAPVSHGPSFPFPTSPASPWEIRR